MEKHVDPVVMRDWERFKNNLFHGPDDDVLQEIPCQTKAIIGKNPT